MTDYERGVIRLLAAILFVLVLLLFVGARIVVLVR